MNPPRILIALVCLGLIAAGIVMSVDVRRPDRPEGTWQDIEALRERDDLNLIVILVDTLRADRMSAYGYERPTTPVIDGLAESGILFESTLAQSTWTKASMASMLMAAYPTTNKITRFDHGIPETATLPSEIFQRAGLRTVGLWRNGWVSSNFGFDQGFDLYVKPVGEVANDLERNPSAAGLIGDDRAVISSAIQFLRSNADQRFYLYLHMMDVHQYVYDASVEFGTTYSDIYDQSIHLTDRNIGNLVAHLQELGLMKKTIVAIVSDHGEAFQEHGAEGHARNLYGETTNVPFILYLPFRLKEPIVVRTPVENVDVFPTLLDLMGLPALPESDGQSAVPFILQAAQGKEAEGSTSGARLSYLDTTWGQMDQDSRPLVLLEDRGFRFHQVAGDGGELYDMATDPEETDDKADENPETVQALSEDIQEHLDSPDPPWGAPTGVNVDELEVNQLRALGYVVDVHAPPGKREIEKR